MGEWMPTMYLRWESASNTCGKVLKQKWVREVRRPISGSKASTLVKEEQWRAIEHV